MANKHRPKLAGLGLNTEVPQPQRYEYDENVAFSPPSSSHMFKIFDSSEVFTQHPRKYPILASQDDNSAQPSGGPSTEIVRHSLQKQRSKSLSSDISTADYLYLLDKAHPSLKGNPGTMPTAAPPIESKEEPMRGPASPTRRSSIAIMDRQAITGMTHPDVKPGLPTYDTAPSQPFRESETGQLSKMFKAAFGTSSSWHHNTNDTSFQEADEDSFGGTTSTTRTQQGDAFVFPPTNEDHTSTGKIPEMVPVTVLPEPRRLFGFGPSYQPPAETVMVPADQSKSFATGGSLVDRVQHAGITAVDGPSPVKPKTRGFFAGVTKEEMNTWAPFST